MGAQLGGRDGGDRGNLVQAVMPVALEHQTLAGADTREWAYAKKKWIVGMSPNERTIMCGTTRHTNSSATMVQTW